MNKVYIVLVNYNNYWDTIECLESLLKSDYSNFQIFVIDNSSNSSSIENLSNWITYNNYQSINTGFKDLVFPLERKPIDHTIISETEFNGSKELYENRIIIIHAKNNGFAAANNIALKYILVNGTNSSFTWILNNDTVVEKNTLHNLVAFYNDNPDKLYVVGAKLKYYDKPYLLQAIAGKYNIWIGRHSHVGDGEKDSGQFDNYKFAKTDYIVGASVFLPKSFVELAGLMCEDYFLYFEELDWFRNGFKNGFTMALAKNAIVYHKEGASIIGNADPERDTFMAEYYSITNRVRFIKKWYPYCLPTIMVGVFFALIKRILKGKFRLVKETSQTIFKLLFM
jgi:GT2 family glycosyltransferase